MAVRSYLASLPRRAKISLVCAGLLVLYGLFGFLALPSIVRNTLVTTITGQMNRQASVGEVRVNPFLLTLTIANMDIREQSGEDLAGFAEFHIDFQSSSIFHRAFTFKEIRLLQPYGLIHVLPSGDLSFSDLFSPTEPQEPEAATPSAEPDNGALPAVLVFALRLEGGRLSVLDESRPTPFDVDLTPINISLDNFSTRKESEGPYAFTATTGRGAVLHWEGAVAVNPLRSEGRIEVEGLRLRTPWQYGQDRLRFEIADGLVQAAAGYILDASGEELQFKLSSGELTVENLRIKEKGGEGILISLPSLSVTGTHVDVASRSVTVESISSHGASFDCWLDREGTFSYVDLFAVEESADDATAAGDGNRTPDEAEAAPWSVAVKEFSADNYAVTFEDRGPAEPVSLKLEPISFTVGGIDSRPGTSLDLSFAAKLNDTGSIAIEGPVVMDPLSIELELDLSAIPLSAFEPYTDTAVRLDLAGGAAAIDGHLHYGESEGAQAAVSYKGSVAITSFVAKDEIMSNEFLEWTSLSLGGMSVTVDPTSVHIDEVVVQSLQAGVVVGEDGVINVATLAVEDTGKKDDAADGATEDTHAAEEPGAGADDPAVGGEAEKEAAQSVPISIDTIRLLDVSASFSDLSIAPNFTTSLQDLNGDIRGLSSDQLSRATVELEGKVDGHAAVKITGEINPFGISRHSDLALSFHDLDLTGVSPYSGKYAGYTIEKGKLSLDLDYKLADRAIDADNKILIDQFTFGERTDSPEATSLPVSLAIALMKDSAGKINIDLPISGDLDHPDFNVGGLVFQAIANLITKAVASPFATLGNLVGLSAEELSFVGFRPGFATLEKRQAGKLASLATALAERPELRVEIQGGANRDLDGPVLAEAELLTRLKERRAAERGSGEDGETAGSEQIELPEADYYRLLDLAYREAFAEDAAPGDEALAEETPEQTEARRRQAVKQRLLETISIDPETLKALAQERARRIRTELVEVDKVAEDRLFLVNVEGDGDVEGNMVRTSLSLTAR